ncbi:hemocytin-like [Pollicipes pollicipes]|uniref:hemocytin-like n=1 Tax=Pollicipes pollicipes TaxID=41117 RepID=UPI001884926E|nr:hemocytin-like [Pollicipes pollicipes]
MKSSRRLLLAAALLALCGRALSQQVFFPDGGHPSPRQRSSYASRYLPPPAPSKVHRGGKTYVPGTGGSSSRYRGGCDAIPPAPMASAIRCSTYSGCRAKCMAGHLFPNGEELIQIRCENGVWTPPEPFTEIPDCAPVCTPACQNGGTCIAADVCQCTEGYDGRYCEVRRQRCTAPRPAIYNARISCTNTRCSVTCARGYETADRRTAFDIECSEDFGWIAHGGSNVIPVCQPICRPHCENGGRCVAFNLCQCPKQWRGPSCQWSEDNCDPNTQLSFNGAYNCTGRGDQFGCQLRCADGLRFSSPPADIYQCDYSTGQYHPTPIPQCEHEYEVIAPTPATFLPPPVAPEPRQCALWAGKHVKTFDGLVYSFTGGCAFTAVWDSVTSLFRVAVVRSCERPDCGWNLELTIDRAVLAVSAGDDGSLVATVKSGYTAARTLQLPAEEEGLVVEQENSRLVIIRAAVVGITVHFSKDALVVFAQPSAWARLSGLCGTLDGSAQNDLLPEGLRATLQENLVDGLCAAGAINTDLRCSRQQQEHARAACNGALMRDTFIPCRESVDVSSFIAACVADFCYTLGQTGDPVGAPYASDGAGSEANAAVCATTAAYAAECERRTSRSFSWRSEEFCPLSCPAGLVFSPCGVRPSNRCGPVVSDSWECEEGCTCPTGLLMDGDQCVDPAQCSCMHNGVRHLAGSSITQDCNGCTCTAGEWTCTEAVCASKCVVAGDPHYLTFDGVRFDYQGKCSYYLLLAKDYSVQAENVPCSGAISEKMNYHPSTLAGQPSCTRSVRIEYQGLTVDLKQGLKVKVNGETPPLVPWWVDGIYIKYASTLYLSVTLPNGVEVWWDGETRAVIHSPGELTGAIGGLCGNNNGNQRDDFSTPEGDIETNVLTFASQWRVDETCDDRTEETTHPCQAHPEKYAEAAKYCDKLVSSPVFQACHTVVDPTPYVKNCQYDMCSCRTELKDCYCVHLADYAEACTANDVAIEWRSEVGLCGVNCPYGQEYKMCGDSCAHSCFDLATNTECEKRCVEGCQCPSGLTLDNEGRCSPISQCPCVHNNKEYKPGHRRYDGKGSSLQLCECVNAHWDCELAKTEPFREDPASKCDASKHMVFQDCLPQHPLTCRSRNTPRPESSKSLPYACEPGCVCEDGLLLDTGSGACVTAEQCPCHHGGGAFAHGQNVSTECRSCTCQSGTWTCEEEECDGVCTAWGNSHYETFDGRIYDIEGDCQYMLAKGKISHKNQFEIIVVNVPCGSGSTCPKAVTVRVGQGVSLEKITLEDGKPLPSAFELRRLSIRKAGTFAFVEAPALGVVVQWDYGTRIYIRLSPQWKNKVKGLCGNFDGNPGDDFRGPSGLLENTAVQFAEQYKLQPYCPSTAPTKDACARHPERHLFAVRKCATLQSSLFADCHSEVDVAPFVERCVYDACACTGGGDCECLCTAIAAYGQACSRRGVHVRWRSNDLCPMQCDATCSTYDPCLSACPPKTCENRYIYEEIVTVCAEDTCVEGCRPRPCPPGEVYSNSSLKSCVKESACRTKCAVIGEQQFFEGDVVSKDKCHVCHCTRGQVKCRGTACPPPVDPRPPKPPEPETGPAPIELQVCKPGWSGWVNRNRPVIYTRPKDVERIPSFIEPVGEAPRSKRAAAYSTETADISDALVTVVDLVAGASDQVTGRITFVQKSADSPLTITGEISGLSAGAHGFHIHEHGRTTDQCRDAGGHFNPAGVDHGSRTSATRHVGDLGNIVADSSGLALVDITIPAQKTSLFGKQSVIGLALVVHAGQDDLGRGGDSGSRATGNAGGRLACGIIKRAYDASTGPAFCADNQVTNVRCRTAGTHLGLAETGEDASCTVQEGLVCHSDYTCQDYELQVFCDCTIEPTEAPPPEPSKPTAPPTPCDSDAWTPWMSSHTPGPGNWVDIEDRQTLREQHSFCADEYITALECRTKLGQKDVTQVGGGAVCDLNHGLVCSDALGYCDDFEVRFFCNCEEQVIVPPTRPTDTATPCSGVQPLTEHESDCGKFYHCVPGQGKVEKTCGPGLMFNPRIGSCDFSANVIKARPSCGPPDEVVTTEQPAVHCSDIHPLRAHPTDCHQYYQCVRTANDELQEYLRSCGPDMMYNPDSMTCDSLFNVLALRPECEEVVEATPTPPEVTTPTPERRTTNCRIRCDQLCHYFSGFLQSRGFCQVRDACKPGCVEDTVGYRGCPPDFVWRDEDNCVRITDCNCRLPNGKPLAAGQVIVEDDGCTRVQCVNNEVIYETSDCRPVTEPPRVLDCDRWGEWIDQTDPNVGMYEVEMLPWWGDFCQGAHLSQIECQLSDTSMPYDTSDDVGVTCDVKSGLTCRNAAQPDGRCHNYRVRYFCSCDAPPTEAPSTPEPTTTTPGPTTEPPQTWPPVIPPEECDVERFVPLVNGDEPLPDSSFSSSSTAGPEGRPSNARITEQPQDAARFWLPASDNQEQYLQVDLGSEQPVYAVKLAGSKLLKSAVVAFELWFRAEDGELRPLTDAQGHPQELTSISPLNEAAPVILPTPMTARYVRLVPRSWQQRIAVKLEVYGCGVATLPPTTTPLPVTVSTVEPPPHCDEEQYVRLLNGNQPLPDSSITASSIVSPEMAARYAKIRAKPDDKLRSWVAKSSDQNQFLQVDLGSVQPVYALIVRGNKAVSSSVTEFELLYSLDGKVYSYAVNQMSQPARLVAADPLGEEPGRVTLPVPVEGRYLRLHPLDWHLRIALKLELFGCSRATTPPPTEPTPPPRCMEPMGIENGLLHNSLVQVSSQISEDHGASAVRPGSAGWIPKQSNNKQFIRINFSDERVLDAVITTGVLVKGEPVPGYPGTLQPDQTRYIGSYRVRYSQDGINWIWVYNKSGRVKVFPGHTERTALKPMQNVFDQPVNAQYIEIMPETWSDDGIGSKLEILGCYHPYPEVTTTTEGPEPIRECQACDDLPLSEMAGCEQCEADTWWNGTACLDGPTLCPCFYNGRAYEVSSVFDLTDCQECICKLRGERVCERKTCPPCGGDLVAHLSDSCDCQCNPCEEGTRICPTSRTCLEEEKWCDGVKQCPDDEGDECREPEATEPPPEPTQPPILPQYCTLKGNTFNTFDDVEYKYQICHHTLLKEEGLWEVTVHRECAGTECRRVVRITTLGELVTIVPGAGVEYGGFTYSLKQASALRSKVNTFKISTTGSTILFNAPDIGFAVLVNNIGNVVVGINNKHYGSVRGLCGDFDGNKYNDKQTPAGELAGSTVEFGDSWALMDRPQSCEPETCQHAKEAFSLCQKIRLSPFSLCHSTVGPDSFISSCLETSCACLDAGKDPDECRCAALTTYITECLSLDPSVELSSWRTEHQCPSQCPPGEVYRDCYRPTCEPSCDQLAPCDVLPDMCFQGCYCPDGQVRRDDRCVDPVDCRDCQCGVYPDGQFDSFDKEERTLNTNCTYLAAGRQEPNGKFNFMVFVDNGNCLTSYAREVTCTDDVRVEWDGNVVLMKRSGQLVEVFVNGAMVEGFYHEYDWGSLSQPPRGSVLLTVAKLHLEISLRPDSGALSVRMPSKVYGGSVNGVCGNCDGNAEDEAASHPVLWLLDSEDPASCVEEVAACVPPPAEQDTCQKMLDEALFGSCHLLEDPAPFVAACQRRTCDDYEHSVCDELELYARRCYERGLCVQWRSQGVCDRTETCPPSMQYRQCSGTCLRSCEKRDCPLLEMDGCFCAEGQVFEDGVCVSDTQCNFCDELGHRPGDSWRPDNCTRCECLPSGSSQCTSVECPPQSVLACAEDETVVELSETATECCPARHECRLVAVTTTTTVAPPTSPAAIHCPDVVEPACKASEGKLMQRIVVNGCPVAVCACVPADQCPPTEELRALKVGERIDERNDTCCPVRSIECEPARCPKAPDCPSDFELHTPPETAADCCPPSYCRQPPGTCLVRLDVAIDIRSITADDTEGFVLKRDGDVWSDGFCDNCTCREVPDGDPRYQPLCVRLACPEPTAADRQQYVYGEDEDSDDPCCASFVRVACRDNGKVHQPGETWAQVNGGLPADPCVTWECALNPELGVVKVPTREKCVEDCRLGHTYVPAAPGSGECCGHCERTACVANGVVRAEGALWNSADGCTEYRCERDIFDDQLTVVSSASLCRDVSDCPPENLYTDETGCCQRCNRTDNCHVKVVPPPETVGMFKEGDCVNVRPVAGIISCQGACDSLAFFDTESSSIQSGCKCCSVTTTRQLDLQLTCERTDVFGRPQTSTIYHTFTVPDGCACSKCDSSSTGLGGAAGAFWQQSTGEEWSQQTGDAGFGGDAFPWGDAGSETTFSVDNGKDVGFVDTTHRGRLPRISDSDFFDLLSESAGPAADENIGRGEIY